MPNRVFPLLALLVLATPAMAAWTGGDEIVLPGADSEPFAHFVTPGGDHIVAVNREADASMAFLRSTDGGITWSTWSTLGDDGNDLTSWVGTAGTSVFSASDRLFVAYRRFNRNSSGTVVIDTINVAWADPNATSPSWTIAAADAAFVSTFGDAHLVTDAANFADFYVYLAYEREDGNTRDLWFARSVDQGTSLETPYRLADATLANERMESPRVAFGFGGWVHVVWTRWAPTATLESESSVLYRGTFLRGDPTRWDANPTDLGEGGSDSQFEPSIAARVGSNGLLVVYQEGSTPYGFVNEAIVRHSDDNGRSWSTLPFAGWSIPGRVVAFHGPEGFGYVVQRHSRELYVRHPETSDLAGAWTSELLMTAATAPPCPPVFDQTRQSQFAVVAAGQDADLAEGNQPFFDAGWFAGDPYPKTLADLPNADSHACIVDLDGDGDDEIVATDDLDRLLAFDDGRFHRAGFPVSVGASLVGQYGQVAAGDFDDDGFAEIFVTSRDGVHCFGHDGQPRPNWPFLFADTKPLYVSVAQITGRSHLEAAIVRQGELHVVNAGGQTSSGFPVFFQPAYGLPLGPACLSDADDDGEVELLVTLEHAILLFDSSGNLESEVWVDLSRVLNGPASVSQIDQGQIAFEIVFAVEDELWVVDVDGSPIHQGWPWTEPSGRRLGLPLSTQLWGTTAFDVLVVTNQSGTENFAYLLDQDAQVVSSSWPRSIGSDRAVLRPLDSHRAHVESGTAVVSLDGTTHMLDDIGTEPAWPRDLNPFRVRHGGYGDFDGDGDTDYLVGGSMRVLELGPRSTVGVAWPWSQYGANAARTGGVVFNTDIVTAAPASDSHFGLRAPAPNPTNGATLFSFALAERGEVEMKVYDLRGRCVRVLADRRFEAGVHSIAWDGRDVRGHELASGVYLVQWKVRDAAGTRSEGRKVQLVR